MDFSKSGLLNSFQRFFANLPSWRYYLRFYRFYYRQLALTIAVSMAQSLVVVPVAILIKYVFDTIIPSGSLQNLLLTGLLIVLLYLINGGATLLTRYASLKITKIAIQDFREELLKNLYSFSRDFYSKADRSWLHTVMVQDTERVDAMSNALLSQIIPAVFISLVVGTVLIYLNWFLFVLVLCTLPFFYLLSKTLGRATKKKVRAFHRSFESFSKGILFVLHKMDLTRIQSAEKMEIDRQRARFEDIRITSGRMAWMRTAYTSVHNATIAISAVIILIVGGRAVIAGSMTLGELLSFYAVVAFLRPQLYMIASSTPQIIEGNASLHTLHQLLDSKNHSPYLGTKQIEFSGKVSFDSVSFSYEDKPVLRDMTLTLHPGSLVAIFGPNGSGKTTIVNLILGFYRPQEGELYADDFPFSELEMIQLRKDIGVVTQNTHMMSGSIWENITYGCPEVSREQVIEASQFATAHEFILQLPEGYETIMGEDGVQLSGGQCQRIAIARAILRRPRLLILDEPTNHLDAWAVRRLMANLKAMGDYTTTLILSHDADIVGEAQEVYLLKEGRVIPCANPMVLLHQSSPTHGSRAGE